MVRFHHRDVLKVTHGIESRISEQSAYFPVRSFDRETLQKRIHGLRHIECSGQCRNLAFSIRKNSGAFPVIDSDTCQRTKCDVRKTVFIPMKVTENLPAYCFKCIVHYDRQLMIIKLIIGRTS